MTLSLLPTLIHMPTSTILSQQQCHLPFGVHPIKLQPFSSPLTPLNCSSSALHPFPNSVQLIGKWPTSSTTCHHYTSYTSSCSEISLKPADPVLNLNISFASYSCNNLIYLSVQSSFVNLYHLETILTLYFLLPIT